jgi:hypothetical protein
MPITPFLRNEAFDPEVITAMSSAFTDTCTRLDLLDRADKITEIVAGHIIRLAQRGILDRATLTKMALEEFGPKAASV